MRRVTNAPHDCFEDMRDGALGGDDAVQIAPRLLSR
jgi:hypothetical protein